MEVKMKELNMLMQKYGGLSDKRRAGYYYSAQ